VSRRAAIAIGLAITAAVGLAILVWGPSGGGRFEADGMSLLYLAMLAVLVGSGVLSYGAGRPGKMVRDLLIWAGIFAAFAVGFAQWQESRTQPTPDGAPAIEGDAQPISETRDERRPGAAIIRKSDDGHFWTDARVNGRPTRFMVDTGASYVALPYSDARRLDVRPRDEDFTVTVQTANGATKAAPVMLREIRISGVTLTNVQAVVLQNGLDTPLLGMSFLNRLDSFEARADTMRLKS
jgi:aspartyl protease family protein